MFINDAVTNIPLTGECDLDLEMASNLFDTDCFISKYGDEYMLVRGDGDGDRPTLKVTIKPCDAVYLIERLKLVEEKSTVFNLASSFKLPTDSKEVPSNG